MRRLIRCTVFMCAFFSSAILHAQDVSGNYTLDIAQDLPGTCVWSGDLNLVQSGGNPGTFTGSATVTPVAGLCPGFSGGVTGTINGSTLDIGVAVGGGASATFSGTVVGPNDLEGTWSGVGFTGVWSAARVVLPPAPPVNSTAVPTLPQWALLMLIVLIAGYSLRYSRRRTE